MPFEVGLAVATARWRPAHQWFLLEARPYRVQQILSDLGGTDAYIHGDGPRRLSSALVDHAPTGSVLDHTQKGVYHTQNGNETDLAQPWPSIGRLGRRIVRQGPTARPRGPLRQPWAELLCKRGDRSRTLRYGGRSARACAPRGIRPRARHSPWQAKALSDRSRFADIQRSTCVGAQDSGVDGRAPSGASACVSKHPAAFIYGSIAKGEDTASSDIDLMVVSDRLAYAGLFAALEKASTELGRKIAPTNDSDLAT